MAETDNTPVDVFSARSSQHLYVISEPAGRPSKIGRAEDPLSRLAGLQVGNPRKLILQWSQMVDHAIAVERGIHTLLQACRLQGEWFDIAVPEALETINRVIVDCARRSREPTETIFNPPAGGRVEPRVTKKPQISSDVVARTLKVIGQIPNYHTAGMEAYLAARQAWAIRLHRTEQQPIKLIARFLRCKPSVVEYWVRAPLVVRIPLVKLPRLAASPNEIKRRILEFKKEAATPAAKRRAAFRQLDELERARGIKRAAGEFRAPKGFDQ